jgi:hypothetical protein
MSRTSQNSKIAEAAETSVERRSLRRITSLTKIGLKIFLEPQKGDPIPTELVNMTTEGILIQTTAIKFLNQKDVQSTIKSIQVVSGEKTIAVISDFKIIRFQPQDNLIAIQISHLVKAPFEEKQVRKDLRLEPKSNFIPLLFCKDPIHPRDTLHFRVTNISINGFEIATSLTNRHLIPGLQLTDAQLLLPGIGLLPIHLLLKRANTKNNELYFGTKFHNPSKQLLESIAQFCLFGVSLLHSDSHIRQLNIAKFPTKKLIKGVKFGLVEQDSEYEKVLEVRYKAYKAANKLDEKATSQDMADPHDTNAFIMYARIGEEFVATARMNRSLGVDDPFSFEKLFPQIQLTPQLRSGAFELTKIAILPENQGTDLLIGLFRFLGEVAFRNQVRNLFGYATSSLEPLYLRLGGKRISDTIAHPVQKNETLRVIVMDLQGALRAKNMSVMTWEVIVKDIVSNLIAVGFIKRKPIIFMYFLRRYVALALFWVYKKVGPAFRQRRRSK